MQRQKISSVKELIEHCGGATKFAAAIDAHAYTIENWKVRGIPHKHWDKIMRRFGVTLEELHAANMRIRKLAA